MMPALYRWLATLLVLGLLLKGSEAQASLPLIYQEPEVTLFAHGIRISWEYPEAELISNPDGTVSVEMASFPQMQKPGYPALPVAYRLVAIPPDSQPELHILSLTGITTTPPGRIKIVTEMGGDYYENKIDGYVVDQVSLPVQTQIEELPPVVFEYLGVMRGVHLGRLIFYPIRQRGESLHIGKSIQLQLDFNSTALSEYETGIETRSDPILQVLRSQVINPEQIQSMDDESPRLGEQSFTAGSSTSVAVIPVTQKGMTQVTYSDLSSAGFPVNTVNPNYLRLEQDGQEVLIDWMINDGDNFFEPNERFLFYANPRFSRWTYIDNYFLFEDFGNPQNRIQAQDANPSGLPLANIEVEKTFETNLIYTPEGMYGNIPAGRDGDRWVWEKIQWTSGQPITTKIYSADLPQLDVSQSAAITLWFIGYTNVLYPPLPDHQIAVSINSKPFDSKIEWNGKQAVVGQYTIPSGVLVSGNNTLSLSIGTLGISPEAMWLDAFKIRYQIIPGQGNNTPLIEFTGRSTQSKYSLKLSSITNARVYDITQPYAPKRLINFPQDSTNFLLTIGDPPGANRRQYLATSDSGIISLPANSIRLKRDLLTGGTSFSGAQYLIVAPQVFMPNLVPLVNLRTSKGLSVAIEDVQAIYDKYSDGRIDPVAIQHYLEDAYHWPTRPEYVLGVGDGTVDPKRNTKPFPYDTDLTFFPPFFDPTENVDPWFGETAADNRFVCVDGNDNLPDMAFGRLPVNSPSDLDAVISKIVTFENSPPLGDWRKTFTLVADNADVYDPGNNFPADADTLAGYIPGNFILEKIYHNPLTDPTPPYPSKVTRPAVINAWNSGRLYMTYLGHSSTTRWATEDFFHYNDISSLVNGQKTPILLELTCFTGRFHQDDLTTLDEALVRFPTGGAVAAFSPTGKGLSSGHRILIEGFLESAFDPDTVSIGQATIDGKLNLMNNFQALDLIDTYLLLGDPAMGLGLSGTNIAHRVYMPYISR